ncbi:MAG TPA: hypothetical protein VNM67_09615 [Thermoanaerobaculia bacterium]|nr:hypothetical protein [Thermoanaerobaculia bacterium]
MAFRYSDLLVDVMASNGGCPDPSRPPCPDPSKPQCPPPSKPQCPDPSVPTHVFVTAPGGGLPLLQEQLRHSVAEARALS